MPSFYLSWVTVLMNTIEVQPYSWWHESIPIESRPRWICFGLGNVFWSSECPYSPEDPQFLQKTESAERSLNSSSLSPLQLLSCQVNWQVWGMEFPAALFGSQVPHEAGLCYSLWFSLCFSYKATSPSLHAWCPSALCMELLSPL